MSDAAAISAPAQAGTPKKAAASAAAKSKKPRVKPTHPRTSEMVIAAVKNLKERGGSSLQAIKKYISANYKVDAEKLAPFIKKYLKSAVTTGSLVQTKGKGASGSFKLSTGEKGEPKKPKKKTTTTTAAKKLGAKAGKKPAAKKLTTTAKKSAPVAAKASSKKAKSTTPKSPAKPKAAAPKTKKPAAAKSPVAAAKKPKAPKAKKPAAAKPKAKKTTAAKKK